jgi:hypothetical protein
MSPAEESQTVSFEHSTTFCPQVLARLLKFIQAKSPPSRELWPIRTRKVENIMVKTKVRGCA